MHDRRQPNTRKGVNLQGQGFPPRIHPNPTGQAIKHPIDTQPPATFPLGYKRSEIYAYRKGTRHGTVRVDGTVRRDGAGVRTKA